MPSFLSAAAVDIVIGVTGFIVSLITYATALQTLRDIRKRVLDISKLAIPIVASALLVTQIFGSVSVLFEKAGFENFDVRSMIDTSEELISSSAFIYAAGSSTVIAIVTSFYSFYSARQERKRRERGGANGDDTP